MGPSLALSFSQICDTKSGSVMTKKMAVGAIERIVVLHLSLQLQQGGELLTVPFAFIST
jgi:hypothetical protein